MLPRPPVSLTRLVGRVRELADLEALAGQHRLVTLTGVGGTGKTRLAAELAMRVEQRHDVAWVELAPCTDPGVVIQQTAAALSLRDGCTTEVLVEALGDRELLLVFDNCEHLIDACAATAAALLPRCPRLRILATSREPLGVAGERVWPVPPIAVHEAVELFVERAAAVDPAFRLDVTNEAAVAEICRRLDGIPLAIELAAARIRVLTPEQITARLEDCFAILSGGSRTAIPRHRTLRAAIDWSFTLLNEREQTLLARLSVFTGTFSLEAVEAICTDDPIDVADVLDLLGSLVEKSLVVATNCSEAVRYTLLETIRQYAAEHLDDAFALRRLHASVFLSIVREAVPELISPNVARLDALDLEHDNIRAAISWSLAHEPDAIALPLAAAFRWYWYYRILWSEGLRWLSRVLERTSRAASPERAMLLAGAGTFTGYLGDTNGGRRLLEEAEALWRTFGDRRQLALTLAPLAQFLATNGELEVATRYAEEAVTLARAAGTAYEVAYCLTNAAAFVAQRGDRLAEADRSLEEAEQIWTATKHPLGLPFVLNARAMLALRRNDHAAAARFARTALVETRARHDLWFSARSLRILALTSLNDPPRAARLVGAADAMMRAMTAGMLLHEKSDHDRLMDALRSAMAVDELEDALEEGRRLDFEAACELALDACELTFTGEAAPQVSLHVNDLGPLQITLQGKPVSAEGRSARELLVFLLAHPDGCTKEEVGVAFWPDATAEQVKNSFHVTLHRLRKLLGSADAISSKGGRYRVEVAHVVESRRFEQEMTAALRTADIARLESAVALYGGDFLQGEDAGEWCLPIRARLRQLALRGLYALGQAQETRGRYVDAVETYTRVLAREPFHEAAARQLMICHARLGSRSESLLIYRQLELRLRDDLQAAPETETRALYRRLTGIED
ncbi:MAG TPA: BTAD domain-containing putative transcriptional regulator [Thermoanaerobaculia bacterium]|jgi:non-specific serine/threonine protein kinase